MKTFSNILNESRSEEVLQKEITRYINAMSGKLPKRVQAALYIINKYATINTKEDILAIRDGHMKIYDKLGILSDDLKDLQKILRNLGNDIKLLPQFLNAHQRQSLEQNKLNINDITLDLETKQGREHVAKLYTPLVMKIVGQFIGKSTLDKAELMSAGLEGLTLAMNDYKSSEEMEANGKKATQTFGQYAAYRIRFAILNEINETGHIVSQSDYLRRKNGDIQSQSIDGYYGTDEEGDKIQIDRLLNLSEEPEYDLTRNEEKQWAEVFKKMEKRFSARDCNIFYRACGINGFDKEEGKSIARSVGVSAPAISQTIKKIIEFLRSDEDTLAVLREILSVYECNLLSGLLGIDKMMVFESIIHDDIYMIAEQLDRWTNDKLFQTAVNKSTDPLCVDDALFIYNCLMKDYKYLEDNYKKRKLVIIAFLNNLYPAETFKRKSDAELMDRMKELIDCSKKFKIKW